MTFPGDVLIGPILRAIVGQPKPRREPIKLPDDRGYGGPDRRFNGWPHSHQVLIGRCPFWLVCVLSGISVGFVYCLLATAFLEALPR
jgi:hypothetical protein